MADLPALAIERIALHLAGSRASDTDGPDPRRAVLPLVSKAWRHALKLAPAELWEQVSGSGVGCGAGGSVGNTAAAALSVPISMRRAVG